MNKNPRGHAVRLAKILSTDSYWNATPEEIEVLDKMVARFDLIMECEEQECDARAMRDFHERAYGNEADDYRHQ